MLLELEDVTLSTTARSRRSRHLAGGRGGRGGRTDRRQRGRQDLHHASDLGTAQVRPGKIIFDGQDITNAARGRAGQARAVPVTRGPGHLPGHDRAREPRHGRLHPHGQGGHRPEDHERVFDAVPAAVRTRGKQVAGTMSGGEQQMLAIGRALMARPRLLLLDEPSMGLAPKLIQQIFSIIAEITKQGTTILLVEQNAAAGAHAGRPRLRPGDRRDREVRHGYRARRSTAPRPTSASPDLGARRDV